MKSPFRSIRQTLFNEGKLVRYLGYAIGEVILIIVGILFALKINDWNEDRKAQVEFDLYIAQLREDVRLAISVAEERMQVAENRKQRSFSFLKHLEGNFDESLTLDELESNIGELGGFVIKEINYGYLGQLLDGELDKIARDKALTKHTLIMAREVKSHYGMILEKRELQISVGTIFNKYRGKIGDVPNMTLGYDLEIMKSSPEFIYSVKNIIHFLSSVSNNYERIQKELESFLTVLEKYE